MKRRLSCKRPLTALTLCTLAGAALGTWADPARAQNAPGFALNRFEPSETGSEWFANDTLDIRGNFRPALGVVGDYGYKPYVLNNPDGSENTSIVTDQLFLHIGGSLVLFDRFRLGLSLPIAVTQDGSASGGFVNGQRVVSNTGAGLGDLRIGGDLRLIGNYGDVFTLALGGRMWLPTGDAQKFLGDDEIRVGPHVAVAGDIDAFAYAGSVGVVYRANNTTFVGHPTGTEATFRMAVGVRALDKKLLIGPEVFGSTVIAKEDSILGARTTPLAILGSAHYTAGDFRFGVGAGPGLSHAAGTPIFRVLASVEYAPGIEPIVEAPPPAPVAVLAPSDRDHDGIFDTDDACPDVAGIKTDDPKTNGCPSDRDKDGIYDKDDACPDVAGIKTDDPKTNGCPLDTDRDKDGILNDVDACPDVPGPKSDDPKTTGCPRVFIANAQIRILEQPKFDFNRAVIKKESDSLLTEVAKVMTDHPEIKRVRIEGHTDSVGSAQVNKILSQQRAQAVAAWLIAHGIDKDRVTAQGMGKEHPLVPNDTDAGRAANRRVEFHIEMQGTTSHEEVKTPGGGSVPAPPVTKPIPAGATPTPKKDIPKDAPPPPKP